MISGLGGDERLFHDLKDQGFTFTFIPYLRPTPNESLRSYAQRMASSIDTTQAFIIGGISFGGILSVEISRFLQPERILLISSIKNNREFPWYLKTFKYLPLHRLLSGNFMRKNAPRAKRSNPAFATILKEMREDADPVLIKWAVDRVLHWDYRGHPQAVTHIHGTKDQLFKRNFLGDYLPVAKGDHSMALGWGEEIAHILKQEGLGFPPASTLS